MHYKSRVLDVLAEHLPDCTIEEFCDVVRVVDFIGRGPVFKGSKIVVCRTLSDLKQKSDDFIRAATEVGLWEPEGEKG